MPIRILRKLVRQYYGSLVLFVVFIILLESTVICVVNLNSPCRHDECHFVETIKEFGKEMSINTIKHYNEMSTPLPFMLYALWGRLFGFELIALRILSIIIAIITYLLCHRLFFYIFAKPIISLLGAAFFTINPYMIGLSVYVYTDMLALLFMILCCIAIIKHKPLLLTVSAAAMLLCRQYYIFFVIAILTYYFLKCLVKWRTQYTHMLIACTIALLPLLALVILWKGVAPDNIARPYFLSEGFYFHPCYLIFYIGQLFVYLLPFVIFTWRYFYKDIRVLIGCFVGSLLYWLFPIRIPKYSFWTTVGIFHRYLRFFYQNMFLEHLTFFIIFFLGLPFIVYIIRDCYQLLRNRDYCFRFFLNLSVINFMLIMPFSYLVWEKYFLPIVPIGTIILLLFRYPNVLESVKE